MSNEVIYLSLLEKWHCHACEKGFLVIEEDAKDVDIVCPFCGENDELEAVVGQNHDDHELEGDMGCLWPGYNIFDKLSYMASKGEITQEELKEYINSLMRK